MQPVGKLGSEMGAERGTLSVCVLASGSKGNSVYLSDGETSILIDAGLSGKAIETRMKERGLEPANLSAILVTHEHTDHIQGVGVLSRRHGVPVFITAETLKAAPQLGKLHEVVPIEGGLDFSIGDLAIHPFSISHDAADPVGFTVRKDGHKIGIATDLGIATGMVRTHLRDCSILVLEANHDPEMLINGPYPWHLKQRIKGRHGHLSNPDTRELLEEIRHGNLKHVVLAHLSETNNTPHTAHETICDIFSDCDTQLWVALQDECGQLIHL